MRARRPRAGLFSSRGLVEPEGWPFDVPDSEEASSSRTEGSNDDKPRALNLKEYEPAELVHGLISASSSHDSAETESSALSERSAPVYVESDEEHALEGVLQMGCMDGFFMPGSMKNARKSFIRVNEKGEKEFKLNLKFPLALGFKMKKEDPSEQDSGKNDEATKSQMRSVFQKLNCKVPDHHIAECDGNRNLLHMDNQTYETQYGQRGVQDPPASVAMNGGANGANVQSAEAVPQIFISLMSLSHGSSADDDCDSNVRPENLVLPPPPPLMYPMNMHLAQMPAASWRHQQAYPTPIIPYELIANGTVPSNLAHLPPNYWQTTLNAPLNSRQAGLNLAVPPAIQRMPSQIVVQEQESFGEEASILSYEVAGTEPPMNVNRFPSAGQSSGYQQGYFRLPTGARISHQGSTLKMQNARTPGAEQVPAVQIPPTSSRRNHNLIDQSSAPTVFTRSILSADSEHEFMPKGSDSACDGDGQAGSVSTANAEEGSRSSLGGATDLIVESGEGGFQHSQQEDDSASAERIEALKSASSSSSNRVGRPPKVHRWRQANIQRLKPQQQQLTGRSASAGTVESGTEPSSLSSAKQAGAGESKGLKDRDGPSFDEGPPSRREEIESKKENTKDTGTDNHWQHSSKAFNTNFVVGDNPTQHADSNDKANDRKDDYNEDLSVSSDQAIVAFDGQEFNDAKTSETHAAPVADEASESFQRQHQSRDTDTKTSYQDHHPSVSSRLPEEQQEEQKVLERTEETQANNTARGNQEAVITLEKTELPPDKQQAKTTPSKTTTSLERISSATNQSTEAIMTEQKHGLDGKEGDENLSLMFDSIFNRRRQLRHIAKQKRKDSSENPGTVPDGPPRCESRTIDAIEPPMMDACDRPSMDASDRPSMDASDRPSIDGRSAEDDDELENQIPFGGTTGRKTNPGEKVRIARDQQSQQGSKKPHAAVPAVGTVSNISLGSPKLGSPATSLSQHTDEATIPEISSMSSTDAVFQDVHEVHPLDSPSKSIVFASPLAISPRADRLSRGKPSAPPMAPIPSSLFF